MQNIKLIKLKCERCGHAWTPRKSIVTVCPECKSPYWQQKPREKPVAVAVTAETAP